MHRPTSTRVTTLGLCDLPPEMLDRICRHVGTDPVSLARLRAVNTTLAHVAGADVHWASYVAPPRRPQGASALPLRFAEDSTTLRLPVHGPTLQVPAKRTALAHLYALAASDDAALTAGWLAAAPPPRVLTPARYFRRLLDGTSPRREQASFAQDETYVRVAWLHDFFLQPPQSLGSVDSATWRTALLHDYDLARAMLPVVPYVSEILPPERLNCPLFLAAAIAGDGTALHWAGANATDAQLASAVQSRPALLRDASASQRANPALVALAARRNVDALAFACVSLRADAYFMAQQVAANPHAIRYLAAPLAHHRGLALCAVRADGALLQHLPAALRADRAVVQAAVQQCGAALAHADLALRDEAALVGVALQQDGGALRYASERLRDDEAVVGLAVRQCGAALAWASARLAAHPAVWTAALQQDPAAFAALPVALRQHDSPALTSLSCALIRRPRPALAIDLVAPVPPSLQLVLFLHSPLGGRPLDASLHDDAGVANALVGHALRADGLSLRFFHSAYADSARHVALAVRQQGLALAFAGPAARADAALVTLAVAQNGLALAYAAEALRRDAALVARAVAQNPLALEFAAPALQQAPAFAAARIYWQGARTLVRSAGFARQMQGFVLREQDRDQFYPPMATRLWSAALAVGSNARTLDHTYLDLDEDDPLVAPFAERAGRLPPPMFAATARWSQMGPALPPPLCGSLTAPLELVPADGAPLQPRHFSTQLFCGALACAMPR